MEANDDVKAICGQLRENPGKNLPQASSDEPVYVKMHVQETCTGEHEALRRSAEVKRSI